jgi:hypothetical protein
MKTHVRSVVVLVALATAGTIFGLLDWAWVNHPGQPWRDTTDPVSELRAERARGRELDEKIAAARRCSAAKGEVVQEVIAGRLALLEAAARLREFDAQVPDFPVTTIRLTVPGSSDEERYCRIVIWKAKSLLAQRPAEAEKVVQRLEVELERHLGRRGVDHPPERQP